MARVQNILPGRLILSLIYSSMDALADALDILERQFGRVQFETVDIPYSDRDRYAEEMGWPLNRRFFSFEQKVARDSLPRIKNLCSRIETNFADRVDDCHFRTVNIDPGILTPENLVMASHRDYNHRVYLTDGVFAETALIYAKGHFCRLPWTSPNYFDDEAIDFFIRVRNTFEVVAELEETPVE
ncbi:MAG: DUF4416 family protein [Candidatus Zixiibacteriota bacterium]